MRGGPWAPGRGSPNQGTGQAVQEGALRAMTALLAASGEVAHQPREVSAGEGAPLTGQALVVQTPGRAACL